MSSNPFTRKRILRNRTIELDADRLHFVDESSSKKSRFPSHSPEPPTFQFPPLYSSQPQSSFTFLIRLFSSSLRSHPLQLLNEERAGEAFLPDAVDSYASPPALKNYKLSHCDASDQKLFFEECLTKLRQNDQQLLSLDIGKISRELESTRFVESLAVNFHAY